MGYNTTNMDDRNIAAVDLGSSKVALTVAQISGENVDILYYKEVPSEGIRNSAVFNPQKASKPVKELMDDAEKELNSKITQVVVGLPRCDVMTEANDANLERVNPQDSITTEEVNFLRDTAQDEYPLADPEREMLYGAVAQGFSDDEGNFQSDEGDIVGVISHTLQGNFKLFIGKKKPVDNMERVFNEIGVAVAHKYFTPEALSNALLTSDEMDSGVALVDFGGDATSVTIYKKMIMRHYAAIPFGGNTITSDIKSECTISNELAENIKRAYGVCQPDRLQNLEDKIIQIEGAENGSYKQIPVKYLSEIITARAKEIVEAILWEIQQSGFADDLRSGVVITGGGAMLASLDSFFKELSGYNVRIGTPRNLFSASGFPTAKEAPAMSSIGMILMAKKDNTLNCLTTQKQEEDVQIPKGIEVPGEPVNPEPGGGDHGTLFPSDEIPVAPHPKPDKKKKGGWGSIIWGGKKKKTSGDEDGKEPGGNIFGDIFKKLGEEEV